MDNKQLVNAYKENISEGLFNLVAFLGFDTEEMTASGCEVKTADGRVLLDFLGSFGALNHGHLHPKVVNAVKEKLSSMGLSSKVLLNGDQARLAKKLADLTPGDLCYSFFSNSGTEAVEAAIKFAKARTGRQGIVHTAGSYHGKSLGSLSAAGRESFRKAFEPLLPSFSSIEFDDVDALKDAMESKPAAFIVEPVQGEAGVRVPRKGYLAAAREITEEAGVLLIADEVQTGIGRTGKLFACEHDGIQPDILCLAKSLGGGLMPIGATVATADVWSLFDENPLLHSSTFGGNHIACAAAIAALDAAVEEDFSRNAELMGTKLMDGLREIDSSLVLDIRGQGLLVGVQFKNSDVASIIMSGLANDGIMIAYTLNNPEVIRLEPPLVVNESQIDRFLECFAKALKSTEDLLSELE